MRCLLLCNLTGPLSSSESSLSEDELSLDSSSPFFTDFTRATLVVILSWVNVDLACCTPTDSYSSKQLEEEEEVCVVDGFSAHFLLEDLEVLNCLVRAAVLDISLLSLSEEDVFSAGVTTVFYMNDNI